MRTPPEISALARTLRETRLPKVGIRIGEIVVKPKRAEIAKIQYNKERFELLKWNHDYTVEIGGESVDLSLQLYYNLNHHYRLFAYSRCGSARGMIFSLNFTTEKDLKGIIGLEQGIQFTEGRSGNKEKARQRHLESSRRP